MNSISPCYGLNDSHLTPHSYVEGLTCCVTIFGDRAFKEIIRLNEVWEGKETPESSVCHVRTQWEGCHLQARNGSLTRTWPGWHLNSDFYAPQLWENKSPSVKPPSLQYFVMTAKAYRPKSKLTKIAYIINILVNMYKEEMFYKFFYFYNFMTVNKSIFNTWVTFIDL